MLACRVREVESSSQRLERIRMQHIAVVGATGAVGREFGALLAQRRFPAQSYRLLASARSAGRRID